MSWIVQRAPVSRDATGPLASPRAQKLGGDVRAQCCLRQRLLCPTARQGLRDGRPWRRFGRHLRCRTDNSSCGAAAEASDMRRPSWCGTGHTHECEHAQNWRGQLGRQPRSTWQDLNPRSRLRAPACPCPCRPCPSPCPTRRTGEASGSVRRASCNCSGWRWRSSRSPGSKS